MRMKEKKYKLKFKELRGQIAQHKSVFVVYVVLRLLVILAMVISFLSGNYENLFLCGLSLILFLVPAFIQSNFGIELPSTLEILILLFIFAAEILGEMESFYIKYAFWDTMLHTINGFLMAAIGFALIDILNNSPKFHFNMSPIFVAFVAFCFSMTVGVVWEFFEFFMDYFTLTDMQKDRMLTDISSVLLNPTGLNDEIVIKGIESTTLHLSDGSTYTIQGGYLELGVVDTMKDLFVNLIGAIVFSVIGYFYIIGRNNGVFAKKFIPQLKVKETATDSNEEKETALKT